MSLMHILMRRAVLIVLACLALALALAVWRAQIDTDREARGSAQVAQLVAALSAMQRVPADELTQHVEALRALDDAEGRLRHLRLRIVDARGLELVALPREAPPPAGFSWLHPFGAVPQWRLQWSIPRPDGLPLTGILSANPGSEQEEALSGVLGLLTVLCLMSALLLLGIYLAVRRALRPLRDILETISHLERGDTQQRLPVLACGELDRIGGALNHLAGALQEAEQTRRQLGARIQTLQEDERAQIALDLHDEFGQQVTGLRAHVRWLQRRTQGQAEVGGVLEELDRECERMQHGMRHLLHRLRPPVGASEDDEGPVAGDDLAAWLRALIEGWHARPGHAVRMDLQCEPGLPALPRSLALACYRMTQEALTNVSRHAGATRAWVRLASQDGAVAWEVRDDGVGLGDAEQALLRGRGLAGLRERVWVLGGTLNIESAPGRGTTLRACLPLRAEASA